MYSFLRSRSRVDEESFFGAGLLSYTAVSHICTPIGALLLLIIITHTHEPTHTHTHTTIFGIRKERPKTSAEFLVVYNVRVELPATYTNCLPGRGYIDDIMPSCDVVRTDTACHTSAFSHATCIAATDREYTHSIVVALTR